MLSADEITTKIRELRAKAAHARWLVKSLSDAQTIANLECYARELEAEADQFENQAAPSLPPQAVPDEQPDNSALAALDTPQTARRPD
jgi:hypothetical protein